MQMSDLPTRFTLPFGALADTSHIRSIPLTPGTVTPTDAPASIQQGFPPATFLPESSGGVPPNGKDFNGILFQLSAWARWLAAGVPAQFNSDFCTAIGGYPRFTILASTTTGRLWQSNVEANLTDPDSTSAAGWLQIANPPTGDDNSSYTPDGKLEQWGYVDFPSTSEPVVPVAFSRSYANALYGVQIVPSINFANNQMDTWVQVIRTSKTASGFSVQYQSVSSQHTGLNGFEWRAIGKPA